MEGVVEGFGGVCIQKLVDDIHQTNTKGSCSYAGGAAGMCLKHNWGSPVVKGCTHKAAAADRSRVNNAPRLQAPKGAAAGRPRTYRWCRSRGVQWEGAGVSRRAQTRLVAIKQITTQGVVDLARPVQRQLARCPLVRDYWWQGPQIAELARRPSHPNRRHAEHLQTCALETSDVADFGAFGRSILDDFPTRLLHKMTATPPN